MMISRRVSQLVQSRPWKSIRYQGYSSDSSVRRVSVIDKAYGMIDIQHFRDQAFDVGKPLLMRRQRDSASQIPAIDKWFRPLHEVNGHSRLNVSIGHHAEMTATEYLGALSLVSVPYELMHPQLHLGGTGNEAVDQFIRSLESETNATRSTVEGIIPSLLRQQLPADCGSINCKEQSEQRMLRFEAPLALLFAALRYNSAAKQVDRLRQLYIAQASLDDLPEDLVKDIGTPDIVRNAGKGDIYASSIWLGLEPTHTPLHRDPNPNLFVQLCSSKVIRLLSPSQGDSVFREVQIKLGRYGGNSRIRGAEMMEGSQRKLLNEAIWEDTDSLGRNTTVYEATLNPGDAVFIPKGWWHSVKSELDDGRFNGSVNWWFR